MAPRKKSKGKKPAETMRQRQMRLRKLQQSLKTSSKQLPPGRKGGSIAKSKSSAITKGEGSAIVKSSSGKATTSSGASKLGPHYGKGPRGMRTRLPEGQKGGALAKKAAPKALPAGKPGGALAKLEKPTGKAGLLTALTVGAAVGDAYRRTNRAKSVSSRGEGRATFNEKKKRMANIPAKEGTGEGSPNDKKPQVKVAKQASQTSNRTPITRPAASKPQSKPPVKASKPSSAPSKPAAPKRSNTDVPSNAKSNPYRMPQGDERKDKSYKAVQELKGMIKASKARQNAQMPKKPAAKKKISRNESNLRRRQGR